jgi:hypothetical protein
MEAPTAGVPQAAFYPLSSLWSQLPQGSDPTDLREHCFAKSKAAAARWSGSEKETARVRQQELNTKRRNKATLLGVFDVVVAVEEKEAAEDETFEEYNGEEFGEEDYAVKDHEEHDSGLTKEDD